MRTFRWTLAIALASLACGSEPAEKKELDCELGSRCESVRSLGDLGNPIGSWGGGLLVNAGERLEWVNADGAPTLLREDGWIGFVGEGERLWGLSASEGMWSLWEHPSGSEIVLETQGNPHRLYEAEAWRRGGPSGSRPYPFGVCGSHAWVWGRSEEFSNCGTVWLIDLRGGGQTEVGEACDRGGPQSELAFFSSDCRHLATHGIGDFQRLAVESGDVAAFHAPMEWLKVSKDGDRLLYSRTADGFERRPLVTSTWPAWGETELADADHASPSLSDDGRWATFHTRDRRLVLADLQEGSSSLLSRESVKEVAPVHSRDGRFLVFQEQAAGSAANIVLVDIFGDWLVPLAPMESKWGHPVAGTRSWIDVAPPTFSQDGSLLFWEDVRNESKAFFVLDVPTLVGTRLLEGGWETEAFLSPSGDHVLLWDKGPGGCLFYANLARPTERGCVTRSWTGRPVVWDGGAAFVDWEGKLKVLPFSSRG